MGSIEKRGKNSYRLIAYVGRDNNGVPRYEKKTVKAPSKKIAKELCNEFERELKNGDYVKPSDLKLVDFINNEWLPKYALNTDNLSPTTRQGYLQDINKRLVPKIGNKKLGSVKTIDLLNILDDMRDEISITTGKNLSKSTIRNHYNAFVNLFDRAVEWKFIKENPLTTIRRPKVKLKQAQAYTPQEMEHILILINRLELRWVVLYNLAFVTASRAGELAAFEFKHVDFEKNGIWRVQGSIDVKGQGTIIKDSTKNGQDSFIKLPEYVMNLIKELKEELDDEKNNVGNMWIGGNSDFLFRDPIGKGISPHSIGQHWRRFCERNKDEIKYLSFHKLRHSSASYLISVGKHAKVVQQVLGHKDIRTTMNIYAHVFDEQKEDVASSFESFNSK